MKRAGPEKTLAPIRACIGQGTRRIFHIHNFFCIDHSEQASICAGTKSQRQLPLLNR
jgi:hypothetical protein